MAELGLKPTFACPQAQGVLRETQPLLPLATCLTINRLCPAPPLPSSQGDSGQILLPLLAAPDFCSPSCGLASPLCCGNQAEPPPCSPQDTQVDPPGGGLSALLPRRPTPGKRPHPTASAPAGRAAEVKGSEIYWRGWAGRVRECGSSAKQSSLWDHLYSEAGGMNGTRLVVFMRFGT